ncbi:SCO family protein [Rhabdochromatium marinum]|uniref:SCO family protein n=1 Tax=Rhabdochromatium marinum TaxID=48729 RepID=UPI001F5B6A6D|nr:SCO family protein [Rhabdochromatium marinum]
MIASVALVAVLAWLWFGWQPQAPQPARLNAEPDSALESAPGGDFVLQSADGPVALADFRGQLVLLYFGYTACPDVCPTNLAMLAATLRALEPQERARVQALFVSVDPQRDHPAHLKQYVEYFHPDILGLTGTEAELNALTQRYGAVYRRVEDEDSALGYLIDHSAATYLIDTQGQLREAFAHATAPEQMLATLRTYLKPAPASQALLLEDVYARAVPPGQQNSAVFMRLRNPTQQPLALIGASSSVAQVVELHTHVQQDGVMKMRRIEQIPIPVQGEAVLQPGGLHLMLIGLKQPLTVGDAVDVQLRFDDGGERAVTADTRRIMPMHKPAAH